MIQSFQSVNDIFKQSTGPALANICQSLQIVKEVDSTPTGAASEETKKQIESKHHLAQTGVHTDLHMVKHGK